MNKISVFDIDGTLFPYGNDLFFKTMRNLLSAEKDLEQFFKGGKTVKAAERILAFCKGRLSEEYGSEFEVLLQQQGENICRTLIDEGEYYPQGFWEIKAAVSMGHDVYLSTANVEPIVKGVISALREKQLLPIEVKVLCSTWRDGKLFANIANNKIVSLEEAAGSAVFDLDVRFYCDDVNGNDKGLADICAWTYVIDGKHNRKDTLPGHAVRLVWEKLSQKGKN